MYRYVVKSLSSLQKGVQATEVDEEELEEKVRVLYRDCLILLNHEILS